MSGIDSIPLSMYQSDFQPFDIESFQKSVQATSIKASSKKFKQKSKYQPIQMDLEILQPFKSNANVRFNLLHQNKPVLQTNPHDPIPKVKLEDKLFEQKLEARHRRSAIYLTPQISLDKIPNHIMYGQNGKGGLASSIYSSDWKISSEIAVKNSPLKLRSDPMKTNFKKEDLTQKAFQKTRFNPENIVPPIDVGLEKYIPMWDRQNPVEFVDRTKLFWEKNKGVGLSLSRNSQKLIKGLTDEDKSELDSCLEEDALRTPFTLHPPGYTGYVPLLAAGVPFRKKKFSKYDPVVTSLMTFQGAYDKDSI